VPRSLNLRSAYYSLNTLRTNLSKLKDSVPMNEKSGVYNLLCSTCLAVYIGQTGRQLKSRIDDHEKAFQNKTPERSNFAKHLLSQNHTFDRTSGVNLLHTVEKSKQITAFEYIEIVKAVSQPNRTVVNEIIPSSPLATLLYKWTFPNLTCNSYFRMIRITHSFTRRRRVYFMSGYFMSRLRMVF